MVKCHAFAQPSRGCQQLPRDQTNVDFPGLVLKSGQRYLVWVFGARVDFLLISCEDVSLMAETRRCRR